MSSKNPSGADNQQGTATRDPQRLYAEHLTSPREMMRQSDPHGDMGRTAEMTVPPLSFEWR
jgi:hypothetical protein